MRPFLFLGIFVFLPLVAHASGAPRTISELADEVVNFFGYATITLVTLGLVIYLWNIASNVMKLGEGETADMKQYYVWGIAILFVMVSIWGIISLLRNTVFNGDVPGGTGGKAGQAACTNFNDCPSA